MKRFFQLLSLFSLASLHEISHSHETPYSIVFVHIGNSLPNYLETAVEQARLFNKDCEIYVIADAAALNDQTFVTTHHVHPIPLQQLQKTPEHRTFLSKSPLRDFWLYASERFLYLHDFMEQYNAENVIHLESDNMIYFNIAELMPIFLKKYNGIAAVFDNDIRCIPGFLYIKNKVAIGKLAECFARNASAGKNDMQILALFKKQSNSSVIDNLPLMPADYKNFYSLVSSEGHTTNSPEAYHRSIDLFNSIFDGAAIGQFLGGIDPRNGPSKPGFINESCLFNPAHFTYSWDKNSAGMAIPYATFNNKKYRINNLHIHCKNLKPFLSA